MNKAMANVLSKEHLMNLNNVMLGLGAPVEIDGKGYNQVDYGKMYYLSSKSEISDNEAFCGRSLF